MTWIVLGLIVGLGLTLFVPVRLNVGVAMDTEPPREVDPDKLIRRRRRAKIADRNRFRLGR